MFVIIRNNFAEQVWAESEKLSILQYGQPKMQIAKKLRLKY